MDDLQDPLPESNWLYRRIFTYVVIVALLAVLTWIVWGMTDALLTIVKGDSDATATVNALRDVAFYVVCFAGWLATTYVIAPSGEQVVKMFQSVKLSLGPTQAPRLPQRRPDPTARITPDDPEGD